MEGFFRSGLAMDLVLAVVVLEAAALVAWYATTKRGLHPLDVVGLQLPGVLLMLALRLALTGADLTWLALCLALALPAHLWDLSRRMQRSRGRA